MSDAPSKAIFLSYAREDAAAVRRIADALRGAGIEVWFDQNELRGGDAWDQKIRQQIKTCALFVPIVSAHTQDRREGYFRLEWKLADERTHLMAEGTPFVLPVVVDETKEDDALVPKSFVNVQWTRLPRAEMPDAFAQRVAQLLGGGEKSPVPRAAVALAPSAGPKKSAWGWVIAALVVIGSGVFFATRPSAPSSGPLPTAANRPPAATQVSAGKSIAVLPFANRSEERANEIFTDGVHEDVLTNLATIADLRVISRTSVMEYRGTTKKLPQIARELGVAYVLEGSVQRAGNMVHVTGQLIDARTDAHLWARSFDRELTAANIFAIQAELAQAIAQSLHAVLSPAEKKLIERRPTENLKAYDLYLEARKENTAGTAYGGSARDMEKRVDLLKAALALDPKFAEGWAFLAYTHDRLYDGNQDRSPGRLALAQAALDEASRLAPGTPPVESAIYFHAYVRGDFAQAAEQLEKLSRSRPNDARNLSSLAALQRKRGQWAEALANARKARDLNPRGVDVIYELLLRQCRRSDERTAELRRVLALQPENFRATATLAALEGRTDDLLAQLARTEPDSPRLVSVRKDRAMEQRDYAGFARLDRLQPFYDDTNVTRAQQACEAAMVYIALGNLAEARARVASLPAELRTRLEREPGNSRLWQDLSTVEVVLGHNDEALRCARKAVELTPESADADLGHMRSVNLAVIQAWTGEKDRALAELGRLVQLPGYLSAAEMKKSVRFHPLLGDPRFEKLINDPKNDAPLF